VYNHFTHASMNVLTHQLMNMTTHVFLFTNLRSKHVSDQTSKKPTELN